MAAKSASAARPIQPPAPRPAAAARRDLRAATAATTTAAAAKSASMRSGAAAAAAGQFGAAIQRYKVPNIRDANRVPSADSVQIIASHGGAPGTSVWGGTLAPRPMGSGP